MTQSLSSILTEDLERGGTLVVPTPQRAAAVRLAYARQCLRAGKHSWRAPRVLPARGWLEAQAQRVLGRADSGLRAAEPAEEWWLWQRAAAQVLEQRAIPFTPTLVPALRRAARLLDEWQMPPAGLRSGGHAEAELLAAVLEEVEARCAARQCVPSHRFLSLVLRDSVPAEPASFAGFTELPAGWHTLIRGMSRGGPAEPEPGTPGEAFAVPAHDEIEELELAAEWCRRQLLADPARRLLVIVPALERRQAAVLRAFTQVLEPDAVLDTGRAAIGARLAIEGGVPLAQYPLVRAGLRSLRLLTGTLEAAELSAWLRDGFWETPGQAERARLDTWLRRTLPLEVSLESLTTRLAGAPPALAPVARALRGRLQRAAGMLRGASERPLGHWARPFAAALTELGWPGSRSLDSEEQQSQARWQLALLEWQGLGAPWGRARAATAAQALRRWLSSVAFAPASSDVPVTLSSQLADPIVRYDGIWVAGLQAETWPAPPRVEPFVPLALQRAAGMSALQPTLLLEQSRQLLARLRAATAQLMLSWATRSEEREQLPSALLAPLRHAPASALTAQQPSLSRQIRLGREIEHYREPPGQPWPLERPLPGGTRAIDHQSRCPFRAYAELRLACTPLEAHLIGPDPRERGQFLHRALELLWQQLGDSRQLAAQQAGGTLDGLIEACVHAAAQHTWADETERVSARARAREERRGRQLLRELVALELTREPFSVAGLEQRSRITLEGALLELRIDRIDRLADDSYVVFDYKTGRVGVLDWQAERPSDPQLLVYLLAQPAAVSALALVRLSPHHVSYQGAADLPSRLPKLSQSRARAPEGAEPSDETGAWLRQTARWRTSITRLARDFIGGAAPVDPLPQACRLCHLHAVCRIGDLRPSGDTQEEPGDG